VHFELEKNESGDDKFDIFCHFYSAYLDQVIFRSGHQKWHRKSTLFYKYSFTGCGMKALIFFFSFAGGGLGPSAPPPSGYAYDVNVLCAKVVCYESPLRQLLFRYLHLLNNSSVSVYSSNMNVIAVEMIIT